MTEPTRCLGRSERDALQRAHARHPGGFEIVAWRKVERNRRTPVELLVRPIGTSATRARSRLRLLACVTAIQAQSRAGAGVDPGSVPVEAIAPCPSRRDVWAFVGAPGSGVTRVVCTLASRLHGRDRCSVGLLSAGDEMHAWPLRGFADAVGLPVHVAANAPEIADAAASLGHRSLVLVDFPGVGPREGERLGAHARALQALAPTAICAVLAADADETVLRRQVEVLRRLGASRIALTRVDLAAHLDQSLRVVASSGLPLAWIGHGAGGSSEIVPASRTWLARACGREPAFA